MLRLIFEKTGDSVWISHLDLMRVFQRAFRRAGLLLKHSQGFTPRAIVSIALPLSVGVESCCEILDFELEDGSVPTAEQLNEKLPEGIRVRKVYPAERKIKDLTHLHAEVLLSYDNGVPEDAEAGIRELFSRQELIMEKHSRKGRTETNILPMLCEFLMTRPDANTLKWDVQVCAQNPSLNPQLLVSALEIYAPQWKPDHAVCRRVEVYNEKGDVFR